MGYPSRVYTVIPWFAARRARKSLWQILQPALTDRPTLLAVLRDKYTSEDKLRPFAPLAERFGGRLHVIVALEWEQEDRDREGEVALRELGVAPEVRPRLLRDEGHRRFALLLRQKRPVAVVEVFFEERAHTTLDGRPDPRGDQIAFCKPINIGGEQFNQAVAEHLQMDERAAADLRAARISLNAQAAIVKREEAPRRDRFELIELD